MLKSILFFSLIIPSEMIENIFSDKVTQISDTNCKVLDATSWHKFYEKWTFEDEKKPMKSLFKSRG